MVIKSIKISFCILLSVLTACKSIEKKQDEDVIVINSRVSQEKASRYNVQLGMAYLRQDNVVRAKRKLVTALKQDPKSASANGAIAYFFEKTGQLEKANDYYHKAMALAPGSGAEYNNYGAYLCRRGHYNEAEKYFNKAVTDINYVNSAAAIENAGLCSLSSPNQAKAKNYFIKALQQDPHRTQSLIQLVKIELSQGDVQLAENTMKYYQAYAQKSPQLVSLQQQINEFKDRQIVDVSHLKGGGHDKQRNGVS